MNLYPLTFEPIYHYRIWGGNKLRTVLNKNTSADQIGESWEISDVENNLSVVAQGAYKGKTLRELILQFKGDLVGNNVYQTFGNSFPLLIKFIDAKTPLSIQVHPCDELAKVRHNSFGKNEMWYIMQADENAEIIVGFDQELSPNEYEKVIDQGNIMDYLHIENPVKGDTFYIPTGRIHAIGAGVLLAEIQQTSDVTYRIYDYNRVDAKTGKTRELHTEQAVDAINFNLETQYKTKYSKTKNEVNKLVHSKYFKTNFYNLTQNTVLDYSNLDSFVIMICVDGEFELETNEIQKIKTGETILIPAILKKINIKTSGTKIIETYL